jgi:hypothetical protein
LALILTGVVADCAYERNAIAEFENKLNDAVEKNYNNAEFVEYFELKKNKEYIETLCIVETPEGMDLTTVVTYDGGETSDLLIIERNMEVGESYCKKSPVSDYYIGFAILENKPKAKTFYHLSKFNFKGSTYWIGIYHLGSTPNPTF